MVSVFDSLFASTGMPVLSSTFGQTVLRIVSGTSTAVDASKVVSFIEDPAVETTQTGKGVIRSGVLRLKDTQAVASTDKYDIDGVRWQAVNVSHEAGGMNVVRVNHTTKEITNSGSKKLI